MAAWFGMATAALWLACAGDHTNPPGSPLCVRHDDCGSGLVCSGQQCLPECDTTADCPEQGLMCIGGACVAAAEGRCASISDCSLPPPCTTLPASCDSGLCRYTPKAAGAPCGDDDSPAVCDGDGGCDWGGEVLTACRASAECAHPDYCAEDGVCRPKLGVGEDCTSAGDAACASGPCVRGRCCVVGGDCCATAEDCPDSYAAPPTCHDVGPSTTCQGSRTDALCTNSVCGSIVVQDDRGCAGLVRSCPNHLAAIACSAEENQRSPACPTRCSATSASATCASGFVCESNVCVAVNGTGSACTGTGQGTCATGLKCESGVCCSASGPTCCTEATLCPDGLACDPSTASCFVTCNDFDTSRCADPALTRCMANTCATTRANGLGCSGDAQCTSRHCVEGVCCDKTCDSTCASCVELLTGLPSGTCNPIEAGLPDTAPALRCAAPGIGCTGTACECAGGIMGSGACRAPLGQRCLDDAGCSTNACECVDAACSQKACAEVNCPPCTYSPDGVSCVAHVVAGTSCNDWSKCTSNDSCNADGECVGIVAPCASPRTCEVGPAICNPSTGLCSYARKPAGTVCRAGVGPCDAVETCDGVAATCPPNGYLPAGQSCGTCNCGTLTCNSTGSCISTGCEPPGTVCPTLPP